MVNMVHDSSPFCAGVPNKVIFNEGCFLRTIKYL